MQHTRMYVVCSHRVHSIISEASIILGTSTARGTTLTTSSSYSKNEQSSIVRFRDKFIALSI